MTRAKCLPGEQVKGANLAWGLQRWLYESQGDVVVQHKGTEAFGPIGWKSKEFDLKEMKCKPLICKDTFLKNNARNYPIQSRISIGIQWITSCMVVKLFWLWPLIHFLCCSFWPYNKCLVFVFYLFIFFLHRLVKRLCDHQIAQVMCGNQHCIALSRGVKDTVSSWHQLSSDLVLYPSTTWLDP